MTLIDKRFESDKMKHNEAWPPTETHGDPHFLLSSIRAANKLIEGLRGAGNIRHISLSDCRPYLDKVEVLLSVPFEGASVQVSQYADFETRAVGGRPQPSRELLAQISEVSPHLVIHPITARHSPDISIVNSPDNLVFTPDRAASTIKDEDGEALAQDGIIVIRNKETEEYVIEIPDADCVKIVGHGITENGEEVIFGAHCGFKGTMRGIVENMAMKLKDLQLRERSINILIGYGTQASVIPYQDLQTAAAENPHQPIHNWEDATSGPYVELDDKGRLKTVYSNQSDVVARVLSSFGTLINHVTIIDENTVTNPSLRSHRATAALTAKHGHPTFDDGTIADKSGRNITRISFLKS